MAYNWDKDYHDDRPERIVCAAIYVPDGKEHGDQPHNIKTGYVIAGRRHNNCYATLLAIIGDRDEFDKIAVMGSSRETQGFITSYDRYVDRFEAYKIAEREGQILYGGKATDPDHKMLISENLY